ncbi:LamG-like jellyroll fold domain-containing protein [Megalodesulfovibrio gigas]|uniref:Uncharacterized protein n=1 Tax=Megalodesulfovibrio gigas (strain ATCC 19364 / DSM 1382 / NCIMB 9332 / VKM B-1759) TaxID=1121448 RepID=T2GCA4_MEGG1|nr:LamG-like jellyroll fold domain-containing protein [Megalodesulfovibrio gigas]AGW13809.1 hypothetical protein DGI_2040 [Megalodesulfovibrio gigas DSM 1382 = ATCC 19364]
MAVLWPQGLPGPQRQISRQLGSNLLSRELQSGRHEVRRFGRGAPHVLRAQLRLLHAQVPAFLQFYERDCNLGLNWFAADWLPLLGYAAHVARFAGYPQRKGVGTLYSDFSVALHVKRADSVGVDTVWPLAGPGVPGVDALYDSVVLLLNAKGRFGSSKAIRDETGRTLINQGIWIQADADGGRSMRFDGSGYLHTPAAEAFYPTYNPHPLPTYKLWVEAWVWFDDVPSSGAANRIVGFDNGCSYSSVTWGLQTYNGRLCAMSWPSRSGGVILPILGPVVQPHTWHHVAVELATSVNNRFGITPFVDGLAYSGSNASSHPPAPASPLGIGQWGNCPGSRLRGAIRGLRITKSTTGRYSSYGFTPPALPFPEQ